MDHQLNHLKKKHVLKALFQIDLDGVPPNNQWNQYWIKYNKRLYPFRYAVSLAHGFTTNVKTELSFSSNDSTRNHIANLGFQICYKSINDSSDDVNYWVGATQFGPKDNLIDMFDDFVRHNYWATDHDLTYKEGKVVLDALKRMKVNDRISVRYFDRQGNKVEIIAIGTIKDTKEVTKGKVSVVWDYNPQLYEGAKPSGEGAGNWWKTLFQLKRQPDIELIFNNIEIEHRMARLTWNSNSWVYPSGPSGKSKNKDSHEYQFKYGHEEWLFDASKQINGFQYGFLEPIRKSQQAYEGKYYRVWLYSIEGETKKRYWVGEIKKLYVINDGEAELVKQHYKDNGWLDEMIMQLKDTCGKTAKFSGWKSLGLFNVKFKTKDVYINDNYLELDKKHPVYTQSRYTFTHYKEEFTINSNKINPGFSFPISNNNVPTVNTPVKVKYTREPKSVEMTLLHRTISDSLILYLSDIYGKDNVFGELNSGYGARRIDIAVRDIQSTKAIFYEIKTYPTLRTSIREALGQLMEYCFYPNKQNADELIIVSHLEADEETKNYLKLLRKTLKFPIYYQSYDWEHKTLSKKW